MDTEKENCRSGVLNGFSSDMKLTLTHCCGHFGAIVTSLTRGDVTVFGTGLETVFVTGELGAVGFGICALAGRTGGVIEGLRGGGFDGWVICALEGLLIVCIFLA